MSRASRVGLALLASAVVLGVLGDALFQGQRLGSNVGIWTACFIATLAGLVRLARAPLHQGRRWMVAPLLLFAALFTWHDSSLLVAANLLAIAAAVSMGALRRTRARLGSAPISDYCGGLIAAGCSALAGAIPLLMTDIRWDELSRRGRSPKVAAAARGLAIGAPLLLLFGGLFVAADAVFKQLVSAAIPTVDASIVGRIAIVVVVAWVAGGLLRDLLAAREERRLVPAAAFEPFKVSARLGAVELNVALAVLDLLFLAFVVVQFRYLFGGKGLVEETAGLTYAEYARHGFFELVAVAALTVPLLLLGDWLLRADARGRRVFRALAIVLLTLLFVVMASALQRMRLYEEQYGLTELRLYATGVILWIAAVCVWFGVTVLRGRRHAFAVGALVSGFAATLALNVFNPDAVIARTNIDRPRVDVAYLAELSDDAVPTLVARLDRLDPVGRRTLAAELARRRPSSGDWRSWNVSRSRAASVLAQHRSELERLAERGP